MNGRRTAKLTLVGILLLTVVLAGCAKTYSRGERVGVVTKLSEKGVIFKSWEGEMLMALPADVAGTMQPEKFFFNVAPEAVVKVKDAMTSGRRVKLVYRQWWIAPPTIDNDHVIVDVQETK